VVGSFQLSVQARQILQIGSIEAKNMLVLIHVTNCTLQHFVESLYGMLQSMLRAEFEQMITKAVYSQAKALEFTRNLESLGYNWFLFKDKLKTQGRERRGIPTEYEVPFENQEMLLRLLPYFETALNVSGKVNPQSRTTRRLLGLTKVEADMLYRSMYVNSVK
jgi:hypothetical protein